MPTRRVSEWTATATTITASAAAALLAWWWRENRDDAMMALHSDAVHDSTLQYFSSWAACHEDSEAEQAQDHEEECGVLSRPSKQGIWAEASFRVARRIVPPRTLRHIMAAAAQAEFSSDTDSIDGDRSFELYLVKRGATLRARLYDIVRPTLERTIVPLVRRVMGCPECDLCDVLIRRYLPDERRGVHRHYDSRAYATAVVTLNAAEYRGGYYVSDDASQQQHVSCDSGDVLVHGFNLPHGVRVTSGARYSLIAWFKREPGHRFSDANPWLEELARGGDPEAKNVLASRGAAVRR